MTCQYFAMPNSSNTKAYDWQAFAWNLSPKDEDTLRPVFLWNLGEMFDIIQRMHIVRVV